MKKSIFSLILIFIIALTFVGCGAESPKDMISDVTSSINSAADRAESSLVGSENKIGTESGDTISKEKAKEIAFKHAEVNEADAYDIEIHLDRDEGILHYDIDFDTKTAEYDYDINAETGKILSSSKEDKQ